MTPTAQDLADGLEVLNDGINMWSAENNLVYEDTLENLAIPAGTQSITIGATGTLVTARPLEIRVATLKSGDINYPLEEMAENVYANISNRESRGQPYRFYYRNTFPNGTLYFDTTTDENYTLDLTSIKNLSTFPDGTTDVSLPPHYEAALKHNLKLWLADEMGAGNRVSPNMVRLADESKKAIIGQSLDIVPSFVEPSGKGIYSISSDSY